MSCVAIDKNTCGDETWKQAGASSFLSFLFSLPLCRCISSPSSKQLLFCCFKNHASLSLLIYHPAAHMLKILAPDWPLSCMRSLSFPFFLDNIQVTAHLSFRLLNSWPFCLHWASLPLPQSPIPGATLHISSLPVMILISKLWFPNHWRHRGQGTDCPRFPQPSIVFFSHLELRS